VSQIPGGLESNFIVPALIPDASCRVYFLKIWTLFDVATIILTVAGVVWNERHKGEYRYVIRSVIALD
jgi:hypothetical protein